MANGNTPGDGKTSMFGDGRGGSGGNMAGSNNFITNPAGSSKGGRIRSFHDQPSAPQKPNLKERSTVGAASGDLVPKVQSKSSDVGVGSIGNNAKPFRLGGG